MIALPTHLIGRHIQAELPDLTALPGPCAVCGAEYAQGWPVERVVSDTFADVDWLTGGRFVCELCLRCLGKGQPRTQWIWSFSSLATESELRILHREDLWAVLTQPPAVPFVLCITFDHKKHMSFKARVNAGGSPFWVRTDKDTARIDLAALGQVPGVLQAWYTICRATAQEPTWFTKDDMLHGCTDTRRIAAYGVERYRAEDRILATWRGDHALDVLVYAVSKRKARGSTPNPGRGVADSPDPSDHVAAGGVPPPATAVLSAANSAAESANGGRGGTGSPAGVAGAEPRTRSRRKRPIAAERT